MNVRVLRFADEDFIGPWHRLETWKLTPAQRVVLKNMDHLKSAFQLGIHNGEYCGITEKQLADALENDEIYIDPQMVWQLELPEDRVRIMWDQTFIRLGDSTEPSRSPNSPPIEPFFDIKEDGENEGFHFPNV